jgi:hypothetical protein
LVFFFIKKLKLNIDCFSQFFLSLLLLPDPRGILQVSPTNQPTTQPTIFYSPTDQSPDQPALLTNR